MSLVVSVRLTMKKILLPPLNQRRSRVEIIGGANRNFVTPFLGNAPRAGKWAIFGARLSQIYPYPFSPFDPHKADGLTLSLN